MGLWDKASSGGSNYEQNTINELCKTANMPILQFTERGGIVNFIINNTRKQQVHVELSASNNMPLVLIYSPACELPERDLPPSKVILDIMAKVHNDPFMKWTVYLSKAGKFILSCSAANFLDFFKPRIDVFSSYVRACAVLADEVEKMTGQDVF